MSLRNAVLATLLEGEASGYDLSKSFDAGVANFWMATPQQLYRELEKMAAQGLIQARVVEQERRPNKRLFSLTEAGHRALYEFTAAPPRPGAMREELMVQVQAVDAGDVEAVMNALRERKSWAESKIARFERIRAHFLGGRTEEEHLATADRIGPYLTLMRGLAFERENLRWCEDTLAILDRRSRVHAE
ncbi:PadR family transcriptional regulator [Actinomadura darangshiensis]|uniref:PadR family transcriptional regulator n=1 Tax=Actinomadura darangshiensis TaxID=705336 RepID=A0A4R5A6G9_9ACTN|nr:PadR family transcriptional regulator [Actinomadura darangshiensis]TDD66399.1 PadR family transcriptional regulator [Actinomadura darangshiensis]